MKYISMILNRFWLEMTLVFSENSKSSVIIFTEVMVWTWLGYPTAGIPNFPTNDLKGGLPEISDKVCSIFQSETQAFKLNFVLASLRDIYYVTLRWKPTVTIFFISTRCYSMLILYLSPILTECSGSRITLM